MAVGQQDAKPTKQKSGFGNPFLTIFIVLAIFVVSQVVAAVIAGLIFSIVHHGGDITKLFDDSAAAQFVYVFLAEGMAVAGSLWAVRKWRRLPLSAIGLGRFPQLGDLGAAALGAVAFYAAIIIFVGLVNFLIPSLNNEPNQDLGFTSLRSSGDHVLAFLALVLVPPLGEEVLVRGYLYSALRSVWRFGPALIITSLLFGAAHLFESASGSLLWLAGLDTFVLSVVLVYLRERTGALYAGILVHTLNNLLAFGVHFK